jgi:diguanylate cyclase (GGDEF)-like protein
MLEGVLEVSARLAGAHDTDTVLQAVCDGIRDALAFDKVVIALTDDELAGGALVPVATSGWEPQPVALRTDLTLEALAELLRPDYEIAGCFLLPHEAVQAQLGENPFGYQSALNGRGPHAWSRHWLLVPLDDSEGRRLGVIWVDDPRDRLLPTHARLQALRLFANQAVAALGSADRVGRLHHEATHDALTGLANRRAFFDRLTQETARSERHGGTFALVLCDMDDLKGVNDTHGHEAGDRALCLLAEILRSGLRRSDEAYRLGGDEFALLLADADRADADHVVDRLRRGLAGGGIAPVGTVDACFGIAVHVPGQQSKRLISEADRALYLAKRERAGETA